MKYTLPNRVARGVTIGLFSSIFFSLFAQTTLHAKGPGTSGGLTLMQASGARPTALGEAFTASSDDITGFTYNPASIESLKTGQASFFYKNGIADDSYGQLLIGTPINDSSIALSFGYFDGGNADVFDGVSTRNVSVKKDMALGLGYSFYIGRLDIGFTGKYLSSRLAETQSASAFAADFGLQFPLGSRARFGTSIQNIGPQLKYSDEGDNLPRTFRSGISLNLFSGRAASLLSVDGIYDLNEANLVPALGLEHAIGPLSIRGGYKKINNANQFSVGMGFLVSGFSFDYSFGMVSNVETQHMLSVSTRFKPLYTREEFARRKAERETAIASTPKKQEVTPAAVSFTYTPKPIEPFTPNFERKTKVYEVKNGDTLESIALQLYRRKELSKDIYNANQFLLGNSQEIKPGQKLILPF